MLGTCRWPKTRVRHREQGSRLVQTGVGTATQDQARHRKSRSRLDRRFLVNGGCIPTMISSWISTICCERCCEVHCWKRSFSRTLVQRNLAFSPNTGCSNRQHWRLNKLHFYRGFVIAKSWFYVAQLIRIYVVATFLQWQVAKINAFICSLT